MKNQYFGDINDYRKYGILRKLNSGKTLVCWMLTKDDTRTDGKFTNYINQKDLFRKFDPILFDKLSSCVLNNIRNTLYCEQSSLIEGAGYFNQILSDNIKGRNGYFTELYKAAQDYDLVFLDPDNGMEVQSVKKGNNNSSKYLYYDEASELYKAGKSLLIYQHFIREERNGFIERTAARLKEATGCGSIKSLRTSNVVFFLLPQTDNYIKSLEAISSIWGKQIRVG